MTMLLLLLLLLMLRDRVQRIMEEHRWPAKEAKIQIAFSVYRTA